MVDARGEHWALDDMLALVKAVRILIERGVQ